MSDARELSEQHDTAVAPVAPVGQRDPGSTLPELLITIMLLGLIVSSLTAAVIVMVRQQDNSEGRLNVARAEASIGMWLPADLASAQDVDVTPGASPCGTNCPANAMTGGSNSLMLTWASLEAGVTDAVASTVNVSYRYLRVGSDYQLVRVECVRTGTGPWSCSNTVVLRELMPPPPGTTFRPGRTSPSWVINVSEPPEAGTVGNGNGTTTTLPPDPAAPIRNAQRVIVTINGGGDADGAGGGLNTISLSAGGASQRVIDATSTAGTPTFNQARTRCGGNYGLIIDDSGSIGGAMPQVIAGVRSFIDAFAGTPVKLQIVRFDALATTFGPGRGRYFDMLVEADVTELRRLVGTLVADGGTNWEDALHRMFYDANGNVQSVLPETLLFFTDGEPTRSRVSSGGTSTPGAPTNRPPRQVELANGTTSYRQEAFNRAKFIADQFRSSVNLIGVGVGPAFSNSSPWLDYGDGWHYDYFRGFHYEARANARQPWRVVDKATYDSSPAPHRRIAYTSPYEFWEPTTLSVYNNTASAGRQRVKDYSPPYDSYDVVTTWTPNSTILTRLIAGNDNGQPAVSVNGAYVNAEVANMYLLPDWSQFTGALQAVALAECGGTVTIQTKVGNAAAADPFEYQHTKSTGSTGLPEAASLDVVKTTRTYPSGTFDFSIPTGGWLTVEIEPMIPANSQYSPAGWSCRTGPNVKTVETFPVNGGPWTGIRLQVRANEAVSCVMQVTR